MVYTQAKEGTGRKSIIFFLAMKASAKVIIFLASRQLHALMDAYSSKSIAESKFSLESRSHNTSSFSKRVVKKSFDTSVSHRDK